MSKLAGWTSGPVLGAGGVILVVVGIGLYATGVIGPKPSPELPEPTDAVAMVEPTQESASDVEPTPAESVEENIVEQDVAAEPDAQETAAADPLPPAPSIDTFRLDPDGSMLVAGQAHPGWTTTVTLDGAALDKVTPDQAGKFVAFLSLDPSDQPRILSLVMRDEEAGQELASLDEIIIAPTPRTQPKPELSAEAADETAPTPDPDVDVAQEVPAADDKGEQPLLASGQETAETVQDIENMSNNAVGEPIAEQAADVQTSQTVLLANEQGVQVIQSPATPGVAPEVMSNVALDAISYSEQGEVQLSGRGQGDGFVRVYLDNAPVTTLQIAEDGNWRGDLPEVDTGVYTLRIDETDAEGNVTSRVETPFKREDEALVSLAQEAVEQQRITAVTVQPGSTLWAISRERYGEGTLYVRVFEANRDRIRDPDLIYPGQVFSLPE